MDSKSQATLIREQIVAGALRHAQIASLIGCAKSTVSYHAKRLNNGAPVFVKRSRRYDWNEVQRVHDSGLGVRACIEFFGMSSKGWDAAVKTGRINSRGRELIPMEVLLSINDVRRGHLRRRLKSSGKLPDACECCGIKEWMGKPLSLHMHHKNGNKRDNREWNIEFLCPNCHSQTDTYAGRNVKRFIAESSNGKMLDSDSSHVGSTPTSAAII